MAARPRRKERTKPLRVACWSADGVRGRKLELEHFLNQHGVDICLLSETFLNPGQAFRLANYVCHRTDRLTAGGGTGPGPPWYSPPLSARSEPDPLGGYCHSSHNGRQTGKNPCEYPLAFPPTNRSGADRLFERGLPVLMPGELNAKHVDWNLQLSTRQGNLQSDYDDENSCLIFGPDTRPLTLTAPWLLPMSWTS